MIGYPIVNIFVHRSFGDVPYHLAQDFMEGLVGSGIF